MSKKKPLYKKWWFWVVVVLVVAAIGGSDSTMSNTSTVENGTEITESTEKTVDNYSKEQNATEIKMSEEEYKSSCHEFNYKDIARNPEKYIGQNFKVEVKVFSTAEGGLLSEYDKYYKANLKSEDIDYYWGEMIYLFDEQDINGDSYVKVLDDDVIVAYGTFEGMVTSKNMINKTKCEDIALHLYYVELISE